MPPQESGDESGGQVHGTNPFLPPPHERNPVRRLRGRLAAPVTLWSTGAVTTGAVSTSAVQTGAVQTGADSTGAGSTGAGSTGGVSSGSDARSGRTQRAALPVSAVVVADGDPGLVWGLVDGDSELWALLESTGRFAVSVLRWEHRALADAFGGLMPAPGGAFRLAEWTDTDWGPVPTTVQTWAGCRLRQARPFGWALAVEAEIERVELGEENDPLLHRRGRYFTSPGG